MCQNATDFINVSVFVKAIAEELKNSLVPVTAGKRIFSLIEAARYCGLPRESFKKKVVRDHIRIVRIDRWWRFDKADLDDWIDHHKDCIELEPAA